MAGRFRRFFAYLTCQSTTPAARDGSPDKARAPSARKSRARAKVSRPHRQSQIPLEYVARDAPVDAEEHQILGRRSSYSVNQPLDAAEPPHAVADTSMVGDSASGLSDQSSLRPTAPLLGPQSEALKGRKCLVLDLDETLVHSSFKFFPDADFVIPVDIEGRKHNVYVAKRPGVDEFLVEVGKLFEVVVFTASVAKYGDPLLDRLGHSDVIHHRLFRESCYNYNGNYIKNLSQLGRPLQEVIIVDNSPASYALHPQHAVPVSTWFSDLHDSELLGMLPFLSDLAGPAVNDVSAILEVATN